MFANEIKKIDRHLEELVFDCITHIQVVIDEINAFIPITISYHNSNYALKVTCFAERMLLVGRSKNSNKSVLIDTTAFDLKGLSILYEIIDDLKYEFLHEKERQLENLKKC